MIARCYVINMLTCNKGMFFKQIIIKTFKQIFKYLNKNFQTNIKILNK